MDEKKRIFIAKDHAILRDGLRAMLASHPDYEIIGEAEDGREAVRGVENSKPGLVIPDLSMLRMNGVGTLKKIKNKDGSCNIDDRSFLLNYECNAVVNGKDFGTAMEEMFEKDLAECEEMTLEQWRKRSRWKRLKNKLVIPLSKPL